MGKNENAFLGIDRAHEAADLTFAAFDEAVQAKKPAHLARLRDAAVSGAAESLTTSLYDHLWDDKNLTKLAAALLSNGAELFSVTAELRALVLKDLDAAAEVAAIQEVEGV